MRCGRRRGRARSMVREAVPRLVSESYKAATMGVGVREASSVFERHLPARGCAGTPRLGVGTVPCEATASDMERPSLILVSFQSLPACALDTVPGLGHGASVRARTRPAPVLCSLSLSLSPGPPRLGPTDALLVHGQRTRRARLARLSPGKGAALQALRLRYRLYGRGAAGSTTASGSLSKAAPSPPWYPSHTSR